MDNTAPHPALEKHYTVSQVAEIWNVSGETVRKAFRNEPGVLCTKLPSLNKRKRQNVSLRIPESVVVRVHGKLAIPSR